MKDRVARAMIGDGEARGLLKPGGNRVAVSAGIFAIEQVENDLLAVRACFIVALHHGQLI